MSKQEMEVKYFAVNLLKSFRLIKYNSNMLKNSTIAKLNIVIKIYTSVK